MANKSVFASLKGLGLRAAATNREAAPAYSYSDAHYLAQVAVTGTFGDLYYQTAAEELKQTVALAEAVPVEQLAKTAIYARQRGNMKDMPVVLLAVLARRDPALFRRVFARVVDNGKMLRNFVQVVRSGQTGRASLGSAPKAMVRNWLLTAPDRALLQANIGRAPSLADVIKMVHPKAPTPERNALFAWILGKPADLDLLPQALQEWMAFKETGVGPVPDVPFQMLTQLPLTGKEWGEIAVNGSWQMVRQGLNTFLRQGAFEDPAVVKAVAKKLADPKAIRRARVMPYQLMVTARSVEAEMPRQIVEALHNATEVAVQTVPKIKGTVVVAPDVSGSMTWPVTGYRKGATSTVRCVDVAALVSAAMLRRNKLARVLPFEHKVVDLRLEPRDTILTNAGRLAAVGGGGTNCSAPLKWLNDRKMAPDLVVFVSDNQSWVDFGKYRQGTAMMEEWQKLKRRNPAAKLVAIDIMPYGTAQALERKDVMNVGGFSDAVFDQIASFVNGEDGPEHWLREIEKIDLTP